jgi:hypothetical protein
VPSPVLEADMPERRVATGIDPVRPVPAACEGAVSGGETATERPLAAARLPEVTHRHRVSVAVDIVVRGVCVAHLDRKALGVVNLPGVCRNVRYLGGSAGELCLHRRSRVCESAQDECTEQQARNTQKLHLPSPFGVLRTDTL